MFSYSDLLFCTIILVLTSVSAQYEDLVSNSLYSLGPQLTRPFGDLYLMQYKLQMLQRLQQLPKQFLQEKPPQHQSQGKVNIQLYYECLCPDCISFDTAQFAPTVNKLSRHLDIHLYPYGNANTIIHADGKIEIRCQHGPAECYGNMLHACAIDLLGNITQAVDFNSCMMSPNNKNKGSDDEAAEKCGRLMNINSEPIKSCAKSSRGLMLLKNYGDESKKIGFSFVPYILINGQQNNGVNFMQDVCAAFEKPPAECS